MISYVAFLRAVNVGGTGKLPMSDLVRLCVDAGLVNPRTYIASGNIAFLSAASEAEVRTALEEKLAAFAGRPVGVIARGAAEIADVLSRNPFAHQPGNRVMALFTDEALPEDPLARATGHANEEIALGRRELFIFYPDGMGRTRLRLAAEKQGTMRNMNTIAKMAALSSVV